jgi:hypothetical protein
MKNIKSMSIATSVTIIAVAVLTIWAELNHGFKDFLKSLTGHHWVTKSVFSIVLFFGLYFLLQKTDEDLDVLKEVVVVIWVTAVASLAIFGFYLWHFFA